MSLKGFRCWACTSPPTNKPQSAFISPPSWLVRVHIDRYEGITREEREKRDGVKETKKEKREKNGKEEERKEEKKREEEEKERKREREIFLKLGHLDFIDDLKQLFKLQSEWWSDLRRLPAYNPSLSLCSTLSLPLPSVPSGSLPPLPLDDVIGERQKFSNEDVERFGMVSIYSLLNKLVKFIYEYEGLLFTSLSPAAVKKARERELNVRKEIEMVTSFDSKKEKEKNGEEEREKNENERDEEKEREKEKESENGGMDVEKEKDKEKEEEREKEVATTTNEALPQLSLSLSPFRMS